MSTTPPVQTVARLVSTALSPGRDDHARQRDLVRASLLVR
jgi:hypothetical protein